MTEKIEDRLVELSHKLETTMVEKAPEAWDAALKVVQIDAFQDIGLGLVAAGAVFIFASSSISLKKKEDKKKCYDDPDLLYFLAILAGAFSLGAFTLSLTKLLTVWNWVGIFSPEMVIAKRALDGIL